MWLTILESPTARQTRTSMTLVVAVTVVVVILEEEVLVGAVTGECDAGDTEAGEDTLEAVEAAEGAGVSPGLTARC